MTNIFTILEASTQHTSEPAHSTTPHKARLFHHSAVSLFELRSVHRLKVTRHSHVQSLGGKYSSDGRVKIK